MFVAVLAMGAIPVQAGGQIFTDEERHVIREVLRGVEHIQSAIDGPEERTAGERRGYAEREHDDHGGKGHKGKKHKCRGGHDDDLPPGLSKRCGDLPPGLQKHLEKNSTLPPGLAKRELPDDLYRRLGPPPKGTGRYIVNEDVVLIEEATGVVLDIIENAFGP